MGFEDVTITYDIACQYKINWWKRIESLPPELRTFAIKNIIWALPVWHGNAHDISCETQNSLKYQLGVGKTDGEGIERKWAAMNPMSYITKEEQPGARHDDLEDLTDLLNFKKNIEMGMFAFLFCLICYLFLSRTHSVTPPEDSLGGAWRPGSRVRGRRW